MNPLMKIRLKLAAQLVRRPLYTRLCISELDFRTKLKLPIRKNYELERLTVHILFQYG